MTPRTLGISRIAVSPIGLGCMGITHASGAPLSQAEGMRVIRQALDLGYTFFDTAECYTGLYPDGTTAWNEDVVGEALAPVRHEVVIATKFGVHHGEGTLLLDSRPQTIRAALEGSLRRLRTDYVDLYYQHRIDPKVEPETVASVMADLIREGKIRAWGISEATEDYLRRAHAVCPVSAIQNRWSMMARWHAPLLPVAEELGIAWVAFSPLANGFLTACYDADTPFEAGTDYRSAMPQYTEEGVAAARDLLALLRDLAREKDATPAQIALAWILCRKPFLIPIPGSRRPDRLRENWDAARIELSKADIARIDHRLDAMHLLVFGGH